jgi:hypothetical protein
MVDECQGDCVIRKSGCKDSCTGAEPFTMRRLIKGPWLLIKGPWLCEHANENPNVCPCAPDCYCKTRTCKDK